MAEETRSTSPTGGEEEEGFAMEFEFDVVTVQEKVDYMAYKSTLGQFKAARGLSDSLQEEHADVFPIAFEILRLLYDQGDYGQLLRTIRELRRFQSSSLSAATTKYQGWDEQESDIVNLMEMLAETSMNLESRNLHLVSYQAVTNALVKLRQETTNDEDVISAVLIYRLWSFNHKAKSSSPNLILKEFSHDLLPEIVSRLLTDEYFWGAEKLLEIWFERPENNIRKTELENMWTALSGFLEDESYDGRRIWAQIGVLQTFCEASLRLESARLDFWGGWFWTRSTNKLPELISRVKQMQGKDTWEKSRAFMRQQILWLDYRIWRQDRTEEGHLVESPGVSISILEPLAILARKNDDIRYQAGILWRIGFLVKSDSPRDVSIPHEFIAVQPAIYRKQRGLSHASPNIESKLTLSQAQAIARSLMEVVEPMRAAVAAAKDIDWQIDSRRIGTELRQGAMTEQNPVTLVGEGIESARLSEMDEEDGAFDPASIGHREQSENADLHGLKLGKQPEQQTLEDQRAERRDQDTEQRLRFEQERVRRNLDRENAKVLEAQKARKTQIDIDAIEGQVVWSPRLIVHNKSSVPLDLRLLNLALSNTASTYGNNVGAGDLRALHCSPGWYRLEAFLSVPKSRLTGGMNALAALFAGLAVSPIFTLPGAIADMMRQQSSTPETLSSRFKERSMEENFDSTWEDGEEDSIRITSSTPMKNLSREADSQMLVMEMTRKGEKICLFRSDPFLLRWCTRLEIRGGPRLIWHENYVQYDFDAKTKPLHAARVDKFTADA